MKPSEALLKNNGSFEKIKQIIESHGFSNPRIFGSVAKRCDTDGSDLDIFVNKGTRRVSLLKLVDLEKEISDYLGVPVQIVTAESIHGKRWEQTYEESISI